MAKRLSKLRTLVSADTGHRLGKSKLGGQSRRLDHRHLTGAGYKNLWTSTLTDTADFWLTVE